LEVKVKWDFDSDIRCVDIVLNITHLVDDAVGIGLKLFSEGTWSKRITLKYLLSALILETGSAQIQSTSSICHDIQPQY
jgi:hypothetical protein